MHEEQNMNHHYEDKMYRGGPGEVWGGPMSGGKWEPQQQWQ